MGRVEYIFGSYWSDLLNVGVRNPRVTTDQNMVLSCLRGSGTHQNRRYQWGCTIWPIVSLENGGGSTSRIGNQVPRPMSGGKDPHERCEDKGGLDIRGHMALGRQKDRTMPAPTRGYMNQILGSNSTNTSREPGVPKSTRHESRGSTSDCLTLIPKETCQKSNRQEPVGSTSDWLTFVLKKIRHI